MKRIAVIPALNEEASIGGVIAGARNFVDSVIVIDDGSSDRTAIVAGDAGAVVVTHPTNMGVGVAFATGIQKALELGAEVVITLDADGQFPVEDIPRIVSPIEEGRADFVTASRFLDPNLEPDMIASKQFGNRLFTNLINWLTGQHFTDTQCGFRAYSKEALLRLTVFGKFTYTQEVIIDLANKRMRAIEIPVRILPRTTGNSRVVKSPANYGLRALKIIVQAERDHHPLRFFTAISLLFIIPALVMFALVLVNWILTGLTSPFTSLVSVGGTLFLIGVIFIILALVADMQGRSRKLQEETLYLLKRQRYS